MRSPPDHSSESPQPPIIKMAFGGILMGIANLIPGLSGGTMILAMGLYTEFIDSVADVTAFRFSKRRILFLTVVVGCAGAAIIGLASAILYLLFHYTTAMYALFIGMTLGGAPLLARSVRPVRADAVVAIFLGGGLMAGVFMLREGGAMPHNTGMDVISGVVGSTTMVLPGISGSYMLLVMDQYDRVVGTVADLKSGIKNTDMDVIRRALGIAIPVGIGVVVGVIALSNVLKYLLHRHERATIGFLLGMLLGSVIGLWPFGRVPSEDAMERRSPIELRHYADRCGISLPDEADKPAIIAAITDYPNPTGLGDPPPSAIAIAALAVLGGFMVTRALAAKGQVLSGGGEAVA